MLNMILFPILIRIERKLVENISCKLEESEICILFLLLEFKRLISEKLILNYICVS